MTHNWVLGSALALLVACNPGSHELSDAHAAAMRDSVQATLAALRQYSAAGQWDSLVRLYADDPRFWFVENGAVRYRSAGQIRQALGSVPPGTRIETTHEGTEITPVAPGVASVATLFHTRFIDSTGAMAFTFEGAATLTLVHRPDGWRILNGHSSSPSPRRP